MNKVPKLNEEDLIFELISGSEKSYTLLFDHYASKLYHYSRKFGLSHQDSECVVQDVFLKVWQRKESLDPSLSLNAYIYKIAKSYIIKRKKRLLLEKVFVQLENQTVQAGKETDSEYRYMIKDLTALIYRLAELLPKSQKQVFEMKNKDHLSMDEIAVKLNVPKRKVENQMYRAYKTIKSKIPLKNNYWEFVVFFLSFH
jgi:RNA polymerase sigma-70 factor (ECF subfamily)